RHKGRKVLLNFWATWCPPCRSELADFAMRAADLKTAAVDLLAASVDEAAARNAVSKFAKDNALPFPVLLGDDAFIATYSLVNRHLFDRRRDLALPTSFLIDEAGRIIKAYVGPASASAVLLDAASRERPALPFEGKWYNDRPQRNYVDLATAMAERGLHLQARALFGTALASGRPDPEVLNNFAALLLEDGELERAETLFRRSFQLDAGQAEVHTNLGTLLLRRNQPEQALAAFEEARRREPDDAYVYNGLGSAYFTLEKLDLAEKLYREAVRMAPGSADYRYNLGTALARNGRHGEAL